MVLRAFTQFFGIFRGQRVILRKFRGQNVGWKSCGNKCNFGKILGIDCDTEKF